MHRRLVGMAAVLAIACLAFAAPAMAAVPSRVSTQLKRADRAMQRASDAIDDGDNAKANTALKSVDRAFASAVKAAKKHPSTDAYGAVADGEHQAIGDLAGLFDGVTDTDTVNQIGTTLKDVISGRDDLISTIGGLSDKSSYADVVQSISDDVADEISAVQDALSDDTLKDPEAKDALNAALTQLQATASTVSSLATSLGTSSSSSQTASTTPAASTQQAQRDGDCPKGEGSGEPGDQQDGTPRRTPQGTSVPA
jgi:hypothetical protein